MACTQSNIQVIFYYLKDERLLFDKEIKNIINAKFNYKFRVLWLFKLIIYVH